LYVGSGARPGLPGDPGYPIVFELEDSGVYNAYVAGLPVYAQGV